MLATGDNGNKLLVWEDCTLEENSRDIIANQTRLMQLHEVDMLLGENKFEAAIKKAFELGLVRGLIKSLEAFFGHYSYITENLYSIIESEDPMMDPAKIEAREKEAETILKRCVEYFLEQDATRFLMFVRDINTKNKYCLISSKILEVLVRLYNLNKVNELHDKLANAENNKLKLEDILAIISSYSTRHYERFREFQKQCQFLNFLVTRVGYLIPATIDEEEQNA
jgi:Utp13 specific WD40 associated domain